MPIRWIGLQDFQDFGFYQLQCHLGGKSEMLRCHYEARCQMG
jgi:hypothetical protein